MKLVLINSNIYTISDTITRAEAVMIEGDKIAAVGTTSDILDTIENIIERSDDENIQSKIRVIDLEGRTIVPGFIDSHTHFLNMGLNYLRVDLSKVENLNQLYSEIRRQIIRSTPGDWIFGIDFDETQWEPKSNKRAPTCAELDDISTEYPIILRRVCGHVAVANSVAIEEIDKYIEQNGLQDWQQKYLNYNTGVLLEDIPLSLNKIIKPSRQEKEEGLRKAINTAHMLGVTSIRDIVNLEALDQYQEFLNKNELKIRIAAYMKFEYFQEFIKDRAKYGQFGDDVYLSIKGVKIFLDGSMGAYTAALSKPYADNPAKYGTLIFTNSELAEQFEAVFKTKFQVMVHAIGDTAIDQLINVYTSFVTRSLVSTDGSSRNSVEHLEVVRPDQLVSLSKLRIIASMQPNFAGQWSRPGGMNEVRLGAERLLMCNAFQTVISNNNLLAFGSDCMPFNPIYGIHCAVNHPIASQRISAFEALKAYTIGSAYAAGDEKIKGSIEPGKFADLVVLSDDILAPEIAEKIQELQIEMTILGGEIVYDSRENE
jgi:predicted amidohydrolase YtcJ